MPMKGRMTIDEQGQTPDLVNFVHYRASRLMSNLHEMLCSELIQLAV